jgi:hypothetical protein
MGVSNGRSAGPEGWRHRQDGALLTRRKGERQFGDPGPCQAFCACGLDRPGGSGEYNLMGEPFETERKRTKAKENKFAFSCFLSLFGIRAFQWVTAEKSGKISSLPPFASGLHLPIFDALLFIDRLRPRIRSCTNAITAFSFSQAKTGRFWR